MKKNKCVYIVSHNSLCLMSDVETVCALMRDVMKHLENVEDEVFVLVRSDKTLVTVEKGKPKNDGVSWRIGSDELENIPYVREVEVEGSRHNSVSEIQYVWVLWCFDDEDGPTAYLTRQAMDKYLKSKGCMDDKGNVKDDMIFLFNQFEVINSNHVKNNYYNF